MNARLRAALLLTILLLAAGATYMLLTREPSNRGFTEVLDVNEATATELDEVPWMTPQMAEGIIEGRPWTNMNDLIQVSGIGEKTLEKVRPHLKFR